MAKAGFVIEQLIEQTNDETLQLAGELSRETVFNLTYIEWKAIYNLLHEAKMLIDVQLHPDGYNIGWNVGEVWGQEVFHAHLHIIPRYSDELYSGKGIRHWLKKPENKRKKY